MAHDENRDPLIQQVTLGEVYRTIQRIEEQVDQLVNAGLTRRVESLEKWRIWMMRGLAGALGGILIAGLIYAQFSGGG